MGLFSKGKKQAPVAEAIVEQVAVNPTVEEAVLETAVEEVTVEELADPVEPAVTIIYPGNISEASLPEEDAAAIEPEVPVAVEPEVTVEKVKVGLSKEDALRLFGELSPLYL